jgi:hypothetical protein
LVKRRRDKTCRDAPSCNGRGSRGRRRRGRRRGEPARPMQQRENLKEGRQSSPREPPFGVVATRAGRIEGKRVNLHARILLRPGPSKTVPVPELGTPYLLVVHGDWSTRILRSRSNRPSGSERDGSSPFHTGGGAQSAANLIGISRSPCDLSGCPRCARRRRRRQRCSMGLLPADHRHACPNSRTILAGLSAATARSLIIVHPWP